ncbi:DUF1285 domain-containing protein [Aliiroseovarius crassostreae]|uniref:DUF1285 domain-containing protein n=1 Tax=Aliiroseovarius crassostreae TaxID=154981 RepID=UPI002202F14D|nr:DUF1285 domain-containing protein [Aliiroseovarius crassostreae]UWQ08570.1 DUF1285 domain-containing protein [Aliiroseovarius crassostreae]
MTKAPSDGKSPVAGAGPDAKRLSEAVKLAAPKGPPPVHLWHPAFSGDMDMRITRDGAWIHEGRPITRPGLVRLFASILRYDTGDDGNEAGYMLVTPVERFRIQVEDVPFIAEDLDVTGEGHDQRLTFTTNLGDTTTAGPAAALRIELDGPDCAPRPYVRVRGNLDARIDRKTFYRLMDLACPHELEGTRWFGLWSDGVFFPITPADELTP